MPRIKPLFKHADSCCNNSECAMTELKIDSSPGLALEVHSTLLHPMHAHECHAAAALCMHAHIYDLVRRCCQLCTRQILPAMHAVH